MGMRLGKVSETFLPAEDHSWIGSAHAVDTGESITLDASAFLTLFPTGIVPSGVVLGKITATGLYAPYAGKNEVQQIAVDATGGTFTISWRGGTTAAIAYNATAAAVQAALELLAEVDPGSVTVSGGPGDAGATTPYRIQFNGDYTDTDVAAVTTSAASLTGGAQTAAVTTVTAGGGGDGTEVAAGILLTTTDLHGTTAGTAVDTPAAMIWHGRVIVAKLPTGHGLDANARKDLSQFRFVG